MLRLTAGDGTELSLALQGGQPCSWRSPDGREHLYLSPLADFGGGSAIRGGIPVIFPQFGSRGPLLRHGFARLRRWQLEGSGHHAQGAGWAALRLDHTPDDDFASACSLRLELQFSARRLEVALEVHNHDAQAFAFTAALHTYLAADLEHAVVRGLEGVRFLDSTHGRKEFLGEERALRFPGEVDRIYLDVPGPVWLEQPDRRLEMRQQGFTDMVVWNPGPAVGAGLGDLPRDGWRRFVCLESALIGQPCELAPGGSWRGRQLLELPP